MMKHYHVVENAPICRGHNLFGLRSTPNFIICTDNIKKYDVNSTEFYVNETIYHESVHIAQECKGSPLGITNIHLSANKMTDVMNSVKGYNPSGKVIEMEAYFLEDNPEQVLYYLKKFCF
jgi:hypothetical protein